ncbi:MAG: MFS transporter [Pyrobaculum sp.]
MLLSSFITPFFATALSVALPSIAREFVIPSSSTLGLLVALTTAIAAFVLPAGQLADMKGYARIFRAGLLIVLTGLVVTSAALTPAWLYAGLTIAGLGLAMVFGSNNALLIQLAPPGRRASLVGLNSMAVYIGLVLGPPTGGMLAEISWRLVFLPAIALGVISYLLSCGIKSKGAAGRLDLLGAVGWGATAVLLILGTQKYQLLAFGLLALLLTLLAERKAVNPLIDPASFKNVVFSASVAASFLNYLSTAALIPVLSLLFQETYALSPGVTGWILALQALAMAVLAPISGRISDRLSPPAVATAGSAVLAGGLLLCAHTPHPMWAIPSLFIIGVGFALFIVPNTTIILTTAASRGFGSAVVATSRVLGQSMSNALAVYMLRDVTPEEVAKLLFLLVIFAVMSAFLSAVRLSKVRKGAYSCLQDLSCLTAILKQSTLAH